MNNSAVLTQATTETEEASARPSSVSSSSTSAAGKHRRRRRRRGWRSSRTSGPPPWRPAAGPWKSRRRTTSAHRASVECSAGLRPNCELGLKFVNSKTPIYEVHDHEQLLIIVPRTGVLHWPGHLRTLEPQNYVGPLVKMF